ncbi:MAG: radical SAM protein [Candidatus Aenigmatarchaeota archaeon]
MQREIEIATRIIEWFKGKKTYPYEVRISPTNRCNLNCLPCISRGKPIYRRGKELSTEKYLEIIRESTELEVKRFDICGGGEPFARKDTIFLLKEIKKMGLEGTVSTNGTLLCKEDLKTLVEIEWDEMRFSLNGPNSQIDDKIRGVRGAFKRTIDTIKFLVRLRSELKKEKPKIIITPVLLSLNSKHLKEFVSLAFKLKADSLLLQPFMPEVLEEFPNIGYRKKLSEDLRLKKENLREFRKALKELEVLSRRYNLHTNFDFFSLEPEKKSTTELMKEIATKGKKFLSIACYYPWWVLDIDSEGNIRPCTRAPSSGDILNKTLEEAWNSFAFKKLREDLAKGKTPSFCKTCCPISIQDNIGIRESLKNYEF